MRIDRVFTHKRWTWLGLLILIVIIIGYTQFITSTAQGTNADVVADCDEIEYLMARNRTPYDFTLNGGHLTTDSATPILSDLSANEWADYWFFSVDEPTETESNQEVVAINLNLDIDAELQLEVASSVSRRKPNNHTNPS